MWHNSLSALIPHTILLLVDMRKFVEPSVNKPTWPNCNNIFSHNTPPLWSSLQHTHTYRHTSLTTCYFVNSRFSEGTKSAMLIRAAPSSEDSVAQPAVSGWPANGSEEHMTDCLRLFQKSPSCVTCRHSTWAGFAGGSEGLREGFGASLGVRKGVGCVCTATKTTTFLGFVS